MPVTVYHCPAMRDTRRRVHPRAVTDAVADQLRTAQAAAHIPAHVDPDPEAFGLMARPGAGRRWIYLTPAPEHACLRGLGSAEVTRFGQAA